MRMVAAVALLAIGLLHSQPARATPDLKTMHGVWQGTIGNLPVQACYDAGEYSSGGKYFYQRRLSTIPLKEDEKMAGDLTEGWSDTKGIARWRIKAITPNEVEGMWLGNGRSLPISLNRLPFATDEEFDGPCGSLAFFQPIFAAARIVKGPGRAQGLAVEKWKLAFPHESVSVESFQLLGSGPATAAINRHLREQFEKPHDNWQWCLRNAGVWGGSYYDEIEARLVTSRWLSVMSRNENSCGGAHPNNSNQPILFDRTNGTVADLYSWFGSEFSNREKVEGYPDTIDTLTGKLFDLVLALHPRAGEDEEDCGGAVKTASSWNLELKPEGITFTPDLPRVVMACGDEVVVPWNKLAPFLSPTGKREVAALRAELRR